MVERGATEMRVGAEVPYYLWPGVPIEATAALALLETSGYDDAGAVLDMVVPDRPPRRSAGGRRGAGGRRRPRRGHGPRGPRVAVVARRGRPRPSRRAAASARSPADGTAVGFGCHSVSRAGWIGPIGTDPAAGRGGVGAAVMAGLCAELRLRGHAEAEICWVGPIAFYAKACHARMSRVFQTRRVEAPARRSLRRSGHRRCAPLADCAASRAWIGQAVRWRSRSLRKPMRCTPARCRVTASSESVGDELVVVDPAGPVGGERPQLGGVEGRVDVHLGDAGAQVADGPLDRAAAADPVAHQHEVVGEDARPPPRPACGTGSRRCARSTRPTAAAAARTPPPGRGRCRRTRGGAGACPCASRGG